MEYLTVPEYAELRGCCRRYVVKLICTGKLRAEETAGPSGGGTGGGLRTKGTEKVHQPTEKIESTAAGAEVKAAGGYAGGDEPGGAAGSCQVEEHP